MAVVGYVFACWTPLMEGLTLPAFVISAIMVFSGAQPENNTEEQEEEMDKKKTIYELAL